MQTMQMSLHFWQIHLPKLNPCCIIWNRQQVALASMWMQTKKSICVLIKKEISPTLNDGSLKLVDKFTFLGSSVWSIKSDINMWLVKAWTVLSWLSFISKSDLSDRIKQFFASSSCVNSTTWMYHMDAA